MDLDSNNAAPLTSAKVVTPVMAHGPVMPTVVPISVALGEKP